MFAVKSADPTTVRWYGFGVYAGDHPRPGTVPFQDLPEDDKSLYRNAILDVDANPLDVSGVYDEQVASGAMTRTEADEHLRTGQERAAAEAARPLDERAAELAARTSTNPRIDLDAGGVVWGFQCWWGPADKFENWTDGRDCVLVPSPNLTELALGDG